MGYVRKQTADIVVTVFYLVYILIVFGIDLYKHVDIEVASVQFLEQFFEIEFTASRQKRVVLVPVAKVDGGNSVFHYVEVFVHVETAFRRLRDAERTAESGTFFFESAEKIGIVEIRPVYVFVGKAQTVAFGYLTQFIYPIAVLGKIEYVIAAFEANR